MKRTIQVRIHPALKEVLEKIKRDVKIKTGKRMSDSDASLILLKSAYFIEGKNKRKWR